MGLPGLRCCRLPARGSPPFSFLIRKGGPHHCRALCTRGMELGLALRPLPPCLSRRAVALPPDFISPCVLGGRRVRATRLKHGVVGAVCNAIMTYSGVEQEMVEEKEEEAEEGVEPAVSTRSRLELIEKPDRSLALLDEYESEELIGHLSLRQSPQRDIASEHPERFFVGEIVTEKIFVQYRQEIPYSCQVNVVSYKSRPSAKDFIQVEILVEKESQRSIILGKDGKAIKMLATASRLDIEDFLQKKVYLEIEVKVKENCRQDERLLKPYGYGGEIQAL